MQPDVATNAKRDQQGLRVTLVAMMNDEPPAHSAYSAFEPVALKNQLAQAAKPSQRMVTALIAKTQQPRTFNSTGLRPHAQSRSNCAARASGDTFCDNVPGSKRLSLLDDSAISNAAIAPPYRPRAVARAD
jgi:hypothetical protein